MSAAVDLTTIHPLIMTPSHDGKFFQNYVSSMLNLTMRAQQAGMPFQVMLQQGESLITRARNNCVASFLASPQYTHLFWIDADIGFSAEAAFRLLASGHDVCAGVYPLKREQWPQHGVPAGTTQQDYETNYTRYTVNTEAPADGSALELTVQPDGFIKLREAPTGFMSIKRSVFEKLIAAYPDHQYISDSAGEEGGLRYRFFDVAVDPVSRRYLSEDYGFCRLWTDIGGSIHVDANSNLSHHGYKTYRGDFAQSLVQALPHAIGAPVGTVMRLQGGEYLSSNPLS